MFKSRFLVSFIALLCCTQVVGQKPDSLLAVYNNAKNADTTRLHALHELAWQMVFSDPAAAVKYVQDELKLCDKTGSRLSKSRAYNTLGCAYHMMGEYTMAIQYHQKALELRTAINDQKGIAASLSNLGSEHLSLSDYTKAVEYYYRSLKIEENLKNESGIAQTYTNLGLLYDHMAEGSHNDADYKRALEFYSKSLEISERKGDRHVSAATLGNMGNLYEHYRQMRKALECQRKSVAYYLEAGDLQGAASGYGNMGNIIQDMNGKELKEIGIDPAHKYDSTLAYYRRCYTMMKQLGEPNGLALSLTNIGWISILKGNYRDAIGYLEEAREMSHSIGDIDGEKQSYELLYDSYKHLKDDAKALYYYEMYILLRDSVYKEESFQEITRKELSFKYARKTSSDSLKNVQERVMVNLKLKQERVTRYYLFAGLALVAIFSLFILNRFRVTKKQKSIIEAQKVIVEQQSEKVMLQKELLEEKNKEVRDSINYAKRLQDVILPPNSLWKKYLPDSFIYYKPKDIVAGDFYWMEVVRSADGKHQQVLFAAADSTGHGVPGALVSVVCSNALNRAVKEFHLTIPGEILDKVRELVIETFRSENTNTEVKDGMDISLISLQVEDLMDLKNLKGNGDDQMIKRSNIQISWAGANNPLWIQDQKTGEITAINGDKQPIGYHHVQKPFVTHTVPFNPGDRIFLFTDGYADQFGGDKGKKFKYSNLKDLFIAMHQQPLSVFPDKLEQTMEEWKGELEQVDDICVIGVRL